MNLESLDIDRIVREIVERLRAELEVKPTAVLSLDSHVITMHDLRDKLNGVQQLVIKPNAIVTPLVRDELKEKNIEIVRSNIE